MVLSWLLLAGLSIGAAPLEKVEFVEVWLTARDNKGDFVTDLRSEDLLVKEKGRAMEVEWLQYRGGDQRPPLKLLLAIDISGSQRTVIRTQIRSLTDWIGRVLVKPADRMALLTYATEIAVFEGMTGDVVRLKQSLQTVDAVAGGTSLYDSLVIGSERLLGAEEGIRIVLGIGAGDDTTSQSSLKQARQALLNADILPYWLSLYDSQEAVSVQGITDLRRLFRRLGGRFQKSNNKEESLVKALDGMEDEFNHLYRLRYRRIDGEAQSKPRKLQIRVKEKKRRIKLRYPRLVH